MLNQGFFFGSLLAADAAVEALAGEANRNAAAVKVNWSFTTEKARDKLKNRYAEVTKITDEIKRSYH